MSKQTELAQVADTITVNSGKIGIGTDSPARTLEVYSSAPAIKLNNGTNAFTIGTGAFVDGSNSLVFFDEGVGERMRIDSAGRVTTPYQPAFLVKKTTSQNNITINQTTTITYQTEIFDQGSDFASNTFTAPVTGKYQFNVNIRVGNVDISAGYYHVHLRTSNLVWPITLQSPRFPGDPVYWSYNASILVNMDAGDTAYVSLYQNNGASQTDIQGSDDNNFSGFLVS